MIHHLRFAGHVLALSSCAALAACGSLTGPPKGWVQKNGATGTYIFEDGARYEGGVDKEGRFDGKGTVTFKGPYEVNYADSKTPAQLRGGQRTGHYVKDRLQAGTGSFVSYKGNGAQDKSAGFTYDGPMVDGTRGNGRVMFRDGRVFEGRFDYVDAPYTYSMKGDFLWDTSGLLGSKISGPGTMWWPNGSTFTGVAYDYYLFDRGTYGEGGSCSPSVFIGRGTLSAPGQPDFEGLVAESYEHTSVAPVTQKRFDAIVDNVVSCVDKVYAVRNKDRYDQARYRESMDKARQDAHRSLMRNLAAMPAQTASTLAQVGAASRGTSVEAEQATARRNAAFQASVAAAEEDPDSILNRNKRAEARRQEEARRADAERRAASDARRDATRQAQAGAAATVAEGEKIEARQQAAEKKRQEERDQQAQQRRLAAEREVQEQLRSAERKRAAEAEALRLQGEKEQLARDEAQARRQYLGAMERGIRLGALHCPDGKGLHYIVGLRPKIKPEVVSCIDVHYTASCPGVAAGSSGVMTRFLGEATDCYMGDTATVSPTPACKPKELRVLVTAVKACGG